MTRMSLSALRLARALFVALTMFGGFATSTLAATPTPPAAKSSTARVLRVGPNETFRTIGAAAQAARSGDTVEIVAGDYVADVAVWERDLVRIVGVGGRPRLIARGASAEDKGTFVVRANGIEIENLAFSGARSPDHYGSAIRVVSGSVKISNSKFDDNEFAILTANAAEIVVDISDCEFTGLAGAGDRGKSLAHTVYAGLIRSLRIEGSYFHRGNVGHLIKSRARDSVIRYNRITDEDGRSSYELEFPSGGRAVVVGNIIEQGRNTEHSTIVSFGVEGLKWPENRLDATFNTIVNDYSGSATFFSVRPPEARVSLRYNVLVGDGSISVPDDAENVGTVRAQRRDFADAEQFDYRPRVNAAWVGAATGVRGLLPDELVPSKEYKHPTGTTPLRATSALSPVSPGAVQRVAPKEDASH